MMTALCRNCLAIFLLLFSAGSLLSAELDCRPLQIIETPYPGPDEFGQGLLWKVTRENLPPSYVFGTIHVADRHVSAQLDKIRDLLADSEVFIMEAIPEPGGIALLRQMMFFDDGTKLQDVISADLYAKTLAVLSAYHLRETDVSAMKPWAAYLTMSYPADMGLILDQQLLRLARETEVTAGGLETMVEQGNLFNSFSLADQVRLLTDAVCHRELLVDDFAIMISLYMDGDLAGLFSYGQRYSFSDNTLYETLTEKLLTRRNHLMVERMRPALEKGRAFIAVGALHLPGEEGVLALLAQHDFEITRVF